jgi:hypothetical protein
VGTRPLSISVGTNRRSSRTIELPLNRRSVVPGTSRGREHIVSPLHLHKGLSRADEAVLAAVPPCAAWCRFVRGILVGKPPRPGLVGLLWGRPGANGGPRGSPLGRA